MRIFEHAFDDIFNFDEPIKFPPIDPFWPFHLPHRNFHEPDANDVPDKNGFENSGSWNDNLVPDTDADNNPTSQVTNNRVYLRNFNDVNFLFYVCVCKIS